MCEFLLSFYCFKGLVMLHSRSTPCGFFLMSAHPEVGLQYSEKYTKYYQVYGASFLLSFVTSVSLTVLSDLCSYNFHEVGYKNHSTQDSRVVPHHGTNQAALWLTAQIGRDAVLSESYGHGQQVKLQIPFMLFEPAIQKNNTQASKDNRNTYFPWVRALDLVSCRCKCHVQVNRP